MTLVDHVSHNNMSRLDGVIMLLKLCLKHLFALKPSVRWKQCAKTTISLLSNDLYVRILRKSVRTQETTTTLLRYWF